MYYDCALTGICTQQKLTMRRLRLDTIIVFKYKLLVYTKQLNNLNYYISFHYNTIR